MMLEPDEITVRAFDRLGAQLNAQLSVLWDDEGHTTDNETDRREAAFERWLLLELENLDDE